MAKAELVVQDAQSYQRMIDRLHHMETIAAIQEGMASAERGELKPATQVFAEMRAQVWHTGLVFPYLRKTMSTRRSSVSARQPPCTPSNGLSVYSP